MASPSLASPRRLGDLGGTPPDPARPPPTKLLRIGSRDGKLIFASSAPPPSSSASRPPKPTSNPEPPKPTHEAHIQNPDDSTEAGFPTTKPRKPRRGRRGEAAAVEDFVRGRLEQVFASIRERNSDVLEGKGDILKPKAEEEQVPDEEEEGEGEQKPVVEEEEPS